MLVRLRLNAGDWRGLEPIQEPFEGVALEFRALTALLILRQLLAERAHALTQCIHRLGLLVDRAGVIILPQRLFGPVHGAPSAVQRVACGLAFGRASAWKTLSLATEFIAERLLAVGQRPFEIARLTVALTALVALRLTLPLLLALLPLAALFMLLALALAAVAALVLLALALIGAWVELFLEIAEGSVAQALLFAQGLGETFHGAMAFGLTALALALGDAHVFHHLLELLQRLLRLGHAALLHQFLDAVHHPLGGVPA